MDSNGIIVTLEHWWKENFCADGTPTISRRTVQRWAKAKAIPGAHKLAGTRIYLIDKSIWMESNRRLLQPQFPHTPIQPKRIQGQTSTSPGKKNSPFKAKGQVGDGLDDLDISRRQRPHRPPPPAK